jgi:DNA polymerase III subunit delta'
MSEWTPRTNPTLYGHDEALATLMADLQAGRLPQGLILSGPRGIGKATLAYHFARELLCLGQHGAQREATIRRIIAGSHVDLQVLEPLFDPKKDEHAREISAEQARSIPESLSLTAGEGQWRLVIIDSADALGNAAANAILKILEEPPPSTLFLLISHSPGRLLPTIRSRCRTLTLRPLSQADYNRAMRHVAPARAEEEVAALSLLSDRSVGLSLELHDMQAALLHTQLLELLSGLPASLDVLALHRLADQLTANRPHAQWQLFTRIMLSLLSRLSKMAAGLNIPTIDADEQHLLQNLSRLHSAEGWSLKWQQAQSQFLLAETRYLDYKQLVIAFIHSIASPDEFSLGAIAS